MARVWITQYTQTGVDGRGHDVPCPKLPSSGTVVVDITDGAAHLMAAPLSDGAVLVALSSDAHFHFRSTVFANPTAATVAADKRVPANTLVYYTIQQGNPLGLALSLILSA